MTNPTPMPCGVEGCEYRTRTGLSSHELLFKDMQLHLIMAHPQLAASVAALNNPGEAGGSQSSVKAEKLTRPTLEEEISEVDWNFFKNEWSRYKRSTGQTGQSIMDQPWACASDNMKKRCHQSGATDQTTEDPGETLTDYQVLSDKMLEWIGECDNITR